MICFISGPISAHKENGYNRESFCKASWLLRFAGHVVLNPASLPLGLKYWHYMLICFAMIFVCDAVYMLAGWQQSKGARMEYKWAKLLRKKVSNILIDNHACTDNDTSKSVNS